jgi:hypothetical protein
MNVVDRGFLYVGVLSIVALAAIALYIATVKIGFRPRLLAPAEVYVGSGCFVYPPLVHVSSRPNEMWPNQIEWFGTPKATNQPYTITFHDGAGPLQGGSSVSVLPGSSSTQTIIPDTDGYFQYTIDNGPCPAWVHVSK